MVLVSHSDLIVRDVGTICPEMTYGRRAALRSEPDLGCGHVASGGLQVVLFELHGLAIGTSRAP